MENINNTNTIYCQRDFCINILIPYCTFKKKIKKKENKIKIKIKNYI